MSNNTISLQIITSLKRKSIAIQVYPDCTIKVMVPRWTTQSQIDEIIKLKQKWINKKIEHFQHNQNNTTKPKEYTHGEPFFYLGKQYILHVVDAQVASVQKTDDTIIVFKTNNTNTKNILVQWFNSLAENIFKERLQVNFQIFSQLQYSFPILKLRKMKARWGSMSNKGIMTLNTRLIHAPLECIDSVIIHELCHLKYQNHGHKFHQLQKKVNPNYKETQHKLKMFANEIRLM